MSKTEVYDGIAKEYQASKQLPFRRYIEEATLFRLAGDLTGKSVLDLASGEGIYARKLKRAGARTVIGIDISKEMIALASAKENEEPLGIRYLVGDASTIGAVGEFDLVFASYLLNYAKTADELVAFCRTIHANLRPDGQFIGFNDNPANPPEHYGRYQKYGFNKKTRAPRVNGSPIVYTLFNPDGQSFSFENFYLSPETYAEAFRTSGFKTLTWTPPLVSPEGVAAHGAEFWREFLESPPMIGLVAKP